MIPPSTSHTVGGNPPQQRTVAWGLGRMVAALAAGILLGLVLLVALVAGVAVLDIRPRSSVLITLATAIVYSSVFLGVWLFLLRGNRASWWDAGFRSVSLTTLLAMFPLTLLLLILNAAVLVGLGWLLGGAIENPQEQALAPGGVLNLTDYLWLLPAVAVAAPIVEELVFRGVLYPYLRQLMRPLFAVLLSAAIFSLVHFIDVLLAPLFVTGVVLALVREYTESILPCILLHALLNGISLTVFYIGLSSSL